VYSKRAQLIFEHSYLISQRVREDSDCSLVDVDEESSEHSDALDTGADTLILQEEDGSETGDEGEGNSSNIAYPAMALLIHIRGGGIPNWRTRC